MKTTAAAVLLFIAGILAAGEAPEVMKIDDASIASRPPNLDGKAAAVLARKLPIAAEWADRPVPTNDWWTQLLFNDKGCRLQAYPWTVGVERWGFRLYLPKHWNEHGTELVAGDPIEIRFDPQRAAKPVSSVIADFEGDAWPTGWTTEGDAFGSGPSHGPERGQTPVAGWQGRGFASSIHGGDGATGRLRSPAFRVERPFIHALIGGGKNAGTRVELQIDGKAVRTVSGRNSETFAWVTLDVKEFIGRDARLLLIDDEKGGWGHLMVDQLIASERGDDPAAQAEGGLVAPMVEVTRWGDWSVVLRLSDGSGAQVLATIVRGCPTVWFECSGVSPRLTHGGWSAKAGTPADAFQLEHAGNQPALVGGFANAEAKIVAADGGTRVTLGDKGFLALTALGAPERFAAARTAAWTLPDDTRFTWTFNAEQGEIATTFTVVPRALRPGATPMLHGWLPHHWRSGAMTTIWTGDEHQTPLGILRVASGTTWTVKHPWRGVVPVLPAPTDTTARQQLAAVIASAADAWADGKKRARDDTYWGGKDILERAQTLAIARQLDPALAARIAPVVRLEMDDWLTYTPGEKSRYFARYPQPWGALIGFNPSFGSELFTDNHFHYGYYTASGALLGDADAAFTKGHGKLLTQIARQYAEWQRDSREFPFLRTFEPFVGHSYAGGQSSPGGNNQESTSEAMQSWGGLIALGRLLGDEAMTTCGMMGYTVERAAVREYWFDISGKNLAPSFGHQGVGILQDWGPAFATFFHGHPRFVYGIQFVPPSPLLAYLGSDHERTGQLVEAMVSEQRKLEAGFAIDNGDPGWGHTYICAEAWADPARAWQRVQKLITAHHPIATEPGSSAILIAMTSVLAEIGLPDPDAWCDVPTAQVYRAADGQRRVVCWNPGDKALTVLVRDASGKLGEVSAPAKSCVALSLAAGAARSGKR